MRVVAYAYDAALHCPGCAHEAMLANIFKREPPLSVATDEHGLPMDLIDSEGNPISAVFAHDLEIGDACDDCDGELI